MIIWNGRRERKNEKMQGRNSEGRAMGRSFARNQRWEEATWASALSPLLSGKGLDAYVGLPVEDSNDYDKLKRALLSRYQLTEEGFRNKFRQTKPAKDESMMQYVAKLRRFLKRWVELGNFGGSYEKLLNLFMREQIISMCNPKLSTFLRERVPVNTNQVEVLAQQYLEAHCASIASEEVGASKIVQEVSTDQSIEREGYVKIHDRKCFNCRQYGHVTRACPVQNGDSQPLRSSHTTSNRRNWSGAACDVTSEIHREEAPVQNYVGAAFYPTESRERLQLHVGYAGRWKSSAIQDAT